MSYRVIKGKFICFEKEFYGIFVVIYNEENNAIEDITVAAGKSSFITTYSLDTSYEGIIHIIDQLFDDEEASLDMSKEVKTLLFSFFNKYETLPDLAEIQPRLKEVFFNFLSADVDLVLTSEQKDEIQAVNIEEEVLKRKEEEERRERLEKYKIPPNTQTVDCFIVLSPIKGKPIKEIKEGDLILCKIDDSTDFGKNIASTYGLYTKDNRLRPAVGKVYRIFQEAGEIVVILTLKSDLMGIAREDEAVKIKCVEPEKIVSKQRIMQREKEIERKKQKKEEEKKEQIKSETTLYIALVVFIVLIAIIIMQFF